MNVTTSSSAPANAPSPLSWLSTVRDRAHRKLATLSWPGRKTEYWLHTPMTEAIDNLPRERPVDIPLPTEDMVTMADLDGIRLVFLDGRFQPDLSCGLDRARGCLKLFSQLADSEQAACAGRINRTFELALNTDAHIGAWQNLSLLRDGVLLQLPPHTQLEHPVHVVFIAGPGSCSDPGATRIICDLAEGARGQLIEHHLSLTPTAASFANHLTEIELAANACLNHYRLGTAGAEAVGLSAAHTALATGARYDGFNLALGGRCQRNDLVVHHLKGGSHCEMNGIYLPRGNEHIDFHSCIEHRVPDCTTNEVFRGIMADTSTAVFNGRIHIHQDAQKTLAELSNRNLLVSPDAEIYTKPELEIYADDVRCAHGATVARLDEQALYYMQSRGLKKQDAETLLSYAFINELIEQIPLTPLARYLQPLLDSILTAAPQQHGDAS